MNTDNRRETTRRNTKSGTGKGSRRQSTSNTSRRRPIQYYVTDVQTDERINISDADAATINGWLALKAEEDALKERMEAMKPSVVALISETGGNVRYKGFELTTKIRKTYQFSAKVNDLETELKAAKKAEIRDETAELVRATEYVEVKAAE